jgi:hypothetical protein
MPAGRQGSEHEASGTADRPGTFIIDVNLCPGRSEDDEPGRTGRCPRLRVPSDRRIKVFHPGGDVFMTRGGIRL